MTTKPKLKYTIVKLNRLHGQAIAVKLRWEDEDGPTAEAIAEAASGLACWHWLSAGDSITVEEYEEAE